MARKKNTENQNESTTQEQDSQTKKNTNTAQPKEDKALGKFKEKAAEKAFYYTEKTIEHIIQKITEPNRTILPIGISGVGKTSFNSKIRTQENDDNFVSFQRTTNTKICTAKVSSDYDEFQSTTVHIIDTPGENPAAWAKAFHEYNPRVLVILVDDREPEIHMSHFGEFLSELRKGGSTFDSIKRTVTGNNANLKKIHFTYNHIDKLKQSEIDSNRKKYEPFLAELRDILNIEITLSKICLNTENAHQDQKEQFKIQTKELIKQVIDDTN